MRAVSARGTWPRRRFITKAKASIPRASKSPPDSARRFREAKIPGDPSDQLPPAHRHTRRGQQSSASFLPCPAAESLALGAKTATRGRRLAAVRLCVYLLESHRVLFRAGCNWLAGDFNVTSLEKKGNKKKRPMEPRWHYDRQL